VARGVFGFAFSPDGRWLYYRTRCTRQAEACDLERVPVAGAAGAAPEELAKGVKSFEFDPRDPERLLITWQRADLVALDLALWQAGKLIAVDQGALAGSIRFVGPDSRRLCYAVVQPRRAGVYLATLPAR
jgi:sugar lactone lactonase YvrE